MPAKAAMVEAVYTFAKTHKVVKSGPIEFADKHVHGIQPSPKFIKLAKSNLEAEVQKYCKKEKITPEPTDVVAACTIETFSRK